MNEIEIRTAQVTDVPLILSFIKELASYEKLLSEVEADEVMLAKNLFGPEPKAEVLLAHLDDKPVGFALFFHNFSTFLGKPGIYLEDLYVREIARGKGVGLQLLSYLAKLAIARECGRLEWWVLDWNDIAIRFYKNLGAKPMDEWTVFRLTGEKLKEVAKLR